MHYPALMTNNEMGARSEGTEPTGAKANGGSHFHWGAFGRRAKDGLYGFPSNLGEQMKRNPYKTLALGVAVGLGLGVVLGSRLLRAVLASTVSYAVVEVARSYLREQIGRPDVSAVVHAS